MTRYHDRDSLDAIRERHSTSPLGRGPGWAASDREGEDDRGQIAAMGRPCPSAECLCSHETAYCWQHGLSAAQRKEATRAAAE